MATLDLLSGGRVAEALPLSLWLPFAIYRSTHRAHHDFEILTEPWRDPESVSVDRATWHRLSAPVRLVLRAHNTLLGRLTETGEGMGTPAYLAPEQGRLGQALAHRADLSAVGVVLPHPRSCSGRC